MGFCNGVVNIAIKSEKKREKGKEKEEKERERAGFRFVFSLYYYYYCKFSGSHLTLQYTRSRRIKVGFFSH